MPTAQKRSPAASVRILVAGHEDLEGTLLHRGAQYSRILVAASDQQHLTGEMAADKAGTHLIPNDRIQEKTTATVTKEAETNRQVTTGDKDVHRQAPKARIQMRRK